MISVIEKHKMRILEAMKYISSTITNTLYIIGAILLFSQNIQAQESKKEPEFIENCTEVYATGEFMKLNSPMLVNAYGLKLIIPVGDKLSINYKFSFGNTSTDDFYLHSTIGSFLGFLILKASNRNDWGYLAFLLTIIPEGVSYHAYQNKVFRITGYINPLGFDYTHNRSTKKENSLACLEFGIQPTFTLFEKALVSPTLGYKIDYNKNMDNGLQVGINIGWRFVSNPKDDFYY